MDVGRVELQGISNEFRLLILRERMADKGIQVAIGLKRPRLSSQATQTLSTKRKENGTQCGHGRGSYARKREHRQWRYDDLVRRMIDKEVLMEWLIEEGLLAKSELCPQCNKEMKLVTCNDRSDGLKWECRIQTSGKRHKTETSIRKGSWFSQSNMTLEEILKFTYWLCQDLEQSQITHELGLVRGAGVDWDSFCREVCEITMFDSSQKLGGEGKIVQIDESKFGKRKYHRGHHVEGQWVFGGIEKESRKCFMIAVDKRDEATLLPLIKRRIEPGTIIISDCWKAYCNLEKHGYTHRTVNHSQELVNEQGDSTNKMEGHWRQAKVKLPPFAVRKHHFSSYLAEFMWRYKHREDDLFEIFLGDVKKLYSVQVKVVSFLGVSEQICRYRNWL